MKIVCLQAENVKRLSAVEIRPDSNLVQITGRNGQGKTSVLDSIWWALAGATHIQAAPIRQGAKAARIRLDLGEIIVTRTFRTKDGGEVTTSISVETAEGARFPSPQRMLDSLLGELSFDPLVFARMDPRQQFDTLCRFVPGVDFDAIDHANKSDYDRRTELNRLARQERAAAEAIVVPEDTPEEPIDVSSLATELQRAVEHNADIERRRANRERVAQQAESLQQEAASLVAQAEELERRARALREQAVQKGHLAAELRLKLESAPPLPEPIDTTGLREHIAKADEINAQVRRRDERRAHERRANQLEEQARALTEAIERRNAEKQAAIAAARMPVPGLSFGDGCVLLNGMPFDQASDAEQLRVSVAIAMALNPKLRVVRIRDGSLLDEDSLRLIAEMADQNDCQVWIERVDSSGRVGFVIEDGTLQSAPARAPAAATR